MFLTPNEQIRLVVPELEPAPQSTWQYLVFRPYSWRRQLCLKERGVSVES
ncbi:MAG: hypothetical protein KME60_32130 [Cyanomargarita calcarea GSE-NOS-MK-12-04C]|jgi:hypothetical protein|uniref:Uncharacterized protein n=1 Tax=Cyanomargarita calcarea GSE-NOS-MK-12-04C TaxID=2839659 RepID=A0A951QT03_9CYAN|nr:hypothetical protein [Cyanomargarita calcarea GSE-NOS-MK-12-04C]